MKTRLSLIGALAALTASACAQSDVIIRQHAKDIRDRNNAQQGVTPPAKPAPLPATPQPTAAQSAVQQSIAKVRADLSAIQPNATVTAEQKEQLGRDLLATAQGASKPSAATVNALATELLKALAQKPLPEKDRNRLMTDLAAVLNPASLQQSQMQAIYKDMQAVFQSNGTEPADATKIVDAAKAVAGEMRR